MDPAPGSGFASLNSSYTTEPSELTTSPWPWGDHGKKASQAAYFLIDSIWYHGYFNTINVFIREVQNSGDLFMKTVQKRNPKSPPYLKEKRGEGERDCKKEWELLRTWDWWLTSFTCRHHTYPLMTQGKYGKGSKPLSWQMSGSWNHSEKNVLRRLKDKNMF